MLHFPNALLVSAFVVIGASGIGLIWAHDDQPLDNLIDPSGEWTSDIGELSLMHTGNTLSFSYMAVFGETAHICEGAGVAGLAGPERYEWGDDAGTIRFILDEDLVTMEIIDGVASFCGAGWAGDRFAAGRFRTAQVCVVEPERSHFSVVDSVSPEQRRAYVIQGDRVDVVPISHEGGEVWVLARFTGPTITTVGFLKKADLDCRNGTVEDRLLHPNRICCHSS